MSLTPLRWLLNKMYGDPLLPSEAEDETGIRLMARAEFRTYQRYWKLDDKYNN